MNEREPKRRAWDLVEDAMMDDEIERLAKMTPEELEAELKKEGIGPAETLEITERAIAEVDRREKEKKQEAERAAPTLPPKVKVVRLDEVRAARPFWRSTPLLAAAAVLLVTVGFLAGRSPTIVALFNPPEPSATSLPRTPNDVMATLREKAFAECAQKDFGGCEMDLDEAQKSDPSGEADPRVIRARAVVLRHKASIDCDRLYWVKCKEKLDQAKEMDPAGEDDDAVKKMRASIAAPAGTGTYGVKER